jgi:hypothetical protein
MKKMGLRREGNTPEKGAMRRERVRRRDREDSLEGEEGGAWPKPAGGRSRAAAALNPF